MLIGWHSWATVVISLASVAVPASAETIQVTIDKLVFSPTEVNAKVGDTIEWINKDNLMHTATMRDGWEVMVPARKAGSLVVQSVGDVEYYCRFHPNMKGRISVAAR